MASPGNRHCANCIGTLSFPIATGLEKRKQCRVSEHVAGALHVAHSAGVSLSAQRALSTQCFAGKMQTIQAALHQRSVGKTRLACSSSSSSNALEMNNSHHVCVSTSPRRTPADRTICIQTYTRDARVADSTTFCRFLFTNAERWWLCYRTGAIAFVCCPD